MSDVRKHLATAKHQQMVQAEGESMDLRKMISQSPVRDGATRADILFGMFVAEHNISYCFELDTPVEL